MVAAAGRGPGRRRPAVGLQLLVVELDHHDHHHARRHAVRQQRRVPGRRPEGAGRLAQRLGLDLRPAVLQLGVLQVHRPQPGASRSTTRAWAVAPASPPSRAGRSPSPPPTCRWAPPTWPRCRPSSGPVVQIPDILGGVAVAYNLPGVSHPDQARRPDPGRHLRRHHHHVERLADRRPQPRRHPAGPRHHPRGPGRQLGHHVHLHRLPEVGEPDGVDARHLEDHRLAVGRGADPEELGRGRPRSCPPRTRSAMSSCRTPSRTR